MSGRHRHPRDGAGTRWRRAGDRRMPAGAGASPPASPRGPADLGPGPRVDLRHLGSMGGVDGLAVADLFCGSGALGVEALSRGAAVGHLRRPRPRRRSTPCGRTWRPSGWASTAATVVRAELPGWLARAAPSTWPSAIRPTPSMSGRRCSVALRADVAVLESSPARSRCPPAGRSRGPAATAVRSSPWSATHPHPLRARRS